MKNDSEYISHYRVVDDNIDDAIEASQLTQAEIMAQHDDYIIRCANELVKAIRVSGRDVMSPEVDKEYECADKFGHVDIFIHNGTDIHVTKAYGVNEFEVIGKLV